MEITKFIINSFIGSLILLFFISIYLKYCSAENEYKFHVWRMRHISKLSNKEIEMIINKFYPNLIYYLDKEIE